MQRLGLYLQLGLGFLYLKPGQGIEMVGASDAQGFRGFFLGIIGLQFPEGGLRQFSVLRLLERCFQA